MEYCMEHKRFCAHKPFNGIYKIQMKDEKTVNIISGFLGAGKTTTVNALLSCPCDRKIDIVVREFGEISVDDQLVGLEKERIHTFFGVSTHVDQQTMLYNYLEGLYDRSDKHPFDHLLIERSGAESAENIVKMFFLPGLREHYRLGAFITTVDGEYGRLNLKEFRVAREQLAFADVVVINKMDCTDAEEAEQLKREIRYINPYAKLLLTSYGKLDPGEVMEVLPYEQLCGIEAAEFKNGGDNAVEEFKSVSLKVKEPLDLEKANRWLVDLFDRYGNTILRGKGFFNIADSDYRFEFQSVRKTFHSKTSDLWESEEEKQSIVVLIGTQLPDRAELQAGLEACRK